MRKLPSFDLMVKPLVSAVTDAALLALSAVASSFSSLLRSATLSFWSSSSTLCSSFSIFCSCTSGLGVCAAMTPTAAKNRTLPRSFFMICPLRSGKWTRWVNEQDLQQREKEDWAGKGLKRSEEHTSEL